MLPNTPTYQPAAAMLAGNLLAIGGSQISSKREGNGGVLVYSPSINSCIYISDLPTPLSLLTAVAVLSSTEILVIGGWGGDCVNTVYKGTLQCFYFVNSICICVALNIVSVDSMYSIEV